MSLKSEPSVPGYNIHDSQGNVLHDGDIVRVMWGGGCDAGGRFRSYDYQRLTIGPTGRLKLSHCSNKVSSLDIRRQKGASESMLGQYLKEYY